MSSRQKQYFELSLDALRAIGGWTAECAGRALHVFEARVPADARPRDAIDEIRVFAAGGRRVALLRDVAMAAHAAARESGDPAAAAAARAAGLAAASAYTHPLVDVHQTVHIVGSAAYAALALELESGDRAMAEAEVRWAIEASPREVSEVLLQMPARETGKGRANELLYALDAGIRARG